MKTTLIALCFQELLPEYTEGGRIGNLFLPTIGGISLILALCTALLAVGMLLWMNSSSGKGRELSRKSLFPAFVSVWLFGFMVYDIGMYTIWIKQGNWKNACPRKNLEQPAIIVESLSELAGKIL